MQPVPVPVPGPVAGSRTSISKRLPRRDTENENQEKTIKIPFSTESNRNRTFFSSLAKKFKFNDYQRSVDKNHLMMMMI